MFALNILSKASSGIFNDDPKKGLTAALQTSMSIPPSFLFVSLTRFSNCSLWLILQGIEIALSGFSLFMSSFTCSHKSSFLLDITTFAP